MPIRAPAATTEPCYRAGAIALALAVAVIVAAIGFERIGGFEPCPLCLQQRYAYYVGIPLLFAALVLFTMGHGYVAGFVFFAVCLLFLGNAGLGVYHAGVEWKFWPGPDTCAAVMRPIGRSAGGILDQLSSTRVVRCDEAPWSFLGLSFAGWNVLTSFVISIAALQAAFAAVRR